VKRDMLAALPFGYQAIAIDGSRQALLATPEKALLDLTYLQPGGDSLPYLRELRLQNLERLELDRLASQAAQTGSAKLRRVADLVWSLPRRS